MSTSTAQDARRGRSPPATRAAAVTNGGSSVDVHQPGRQLPQPAAAAGAGTARPAPPGRPRPAPRPRPPGRARPPRGRPPSPRHATRSIAHRRRAPRTDPRPAPRAPVEHARRGRTSCDRWNGLPPPGLRRTSDARRTDGPTGATTRPRSRLVRVAQSDRQPLGRQVVQGGPDERAEQRVRPGRPGLELRMGLGGDEERVQRPVELDELHQRRVRRGAGQPHAGGLQPVPVGVVHLVPVPVPFGNLCAAVDLGHQRAGRQPRRIGAQPHGAAHVGLTGDDVGLVGHGGDHRIGGVRRRTPRSWHRRARPGCGRSRSPCTAGRGTGRASGSD